MNIKYFDTDNSNTKLNVELKPGEAMIVNHNGSAEHGISIVLNENGEFIVTGPFNRSAQKVVFNPKTSNHG